MDIIGITTLILEQDVCIVFQTFDVKYVILKDIHVLNYRCFYFNSLQFNKYLLDAYTMLSIVIGNLPLLYYLI